MKIFLLLALFFLTLPTINAQNASWATYAGSVGNDEVYTLTTDKNGNIVQAGAFWQTLILGSDTLESKGSINSYLAKYDSLGNIQWARPIPGTQIVYACGLKTDSQGNIYVSGFFTNTFLLNGDSIPSKGSADIFLAKFSEEGELIWKKFVKGIQGERSFDLEINLQGNPVLLGEIGKNAEFDTINLGNENPEVFYAEFSSDGELIQLKYTRNMDGGYFDLNEGHIDASGNTYMAGSFHGRVYFDSMFVESNINSFDFPDYLVKYNANGQAVWARKMRSGFGLNVNSIITDALNNVYISGTSLHGFSIFAPNDTLNSTDNGNSTGFIAKFDSEGNILWLRNINETETLEDGENSVLMLAINDEGKLTAGGFFDGSFGYDSFQYASNNTMRAFILLLDPENGTAVGSTALGSASANYMTRMAYASDGNLLITGRFSPTIQFSPLALQTSNGGTDIYLAKISPPLVTATQEPITQNRFHIYPNPANNLLYFNLPANSIDSGQLSIHDLAGKEVFTSAVKSNQTSIGLPFLPDGMYVLEFTNSKASYRQKLVIQH